MNIKRYLTSLLGIILITLTIMQSSCKEDHMYKDIPNIFTDTTIYVGSMLYHNLESVGGWGYTPNGYKGLFIYCSAPGEYVAFERCCTYDPRLPESMVYYNPDELVLIDSACCGARFSPWTGSPLNNDHATIPLRPYRTQYYENRKMLKITNY